jgi:hypothetical protein
MEELVAATVEMNEEQSIPLSEGASDLIDQGFIAAGDGLVTRLQRG